MKTDYKAGIEDYVGLYARSKKGRAIRIEEKLYSKNLDNIFAYINGCRGVNRATKDFLDNKAIKVVRNWDTYLENHFGKIIDFLLEIRNLIDSDSYYEFSYEVYQKLYFAETKLGAFFFGKF